MKVAEIKVSAKLDIKKKHDKLKKQDLIYKILDEQAVNPPSKASEAAQINQANLESRLSNKEVAPVASKEDSTPVESLSLKRLLRKETPLG